MVGRRLFPVAGAFLVSAVAVTSAYSQSNELRITQDGVGNELTVDQSLASESMIGGQGLFFRSNTNAPALQIGSGNRAEITDGGLRNRITLEQLSPSSGQGNTANIAVNAGRSNVGASGNSGEAAAIASDFSGGSNTAIVLQDGTNNRANVNIDGQLSSGGILQQGDDNQARVDVEGTGVFAAIRQVGNDNEMGLAVSGTTGTNVVYNQIGNGLEGQQPSVVTNGATVIITQTSFGAFSSGSGQ